MRFYLDNDVDARCRRVLASHDCWTASEAGLADASDDEQAVYAHEHRAVIITQDREFTRRQRKNTVGKHVCLCVEQPDGPELLAQHIEDILPILERREFVVIELRQGSFQVLHGRWL